MRVFQERFQWHMGLVVADWRYVVRIANLDISDIVASTATPIIDAMELALSKLPSSMGNQRFYMNRTMKYLLNRERRRAVGDGGGITFENVDGQKKRQMYFQDVEIRQVDQILTTETAVS